MTARMQLVGLLLTTITACSRQPDRSLVEAEFERSQHLEAVKDAETLRDEISTIPGTFYLRYLFSGSSTGATPQLLIVATDRASIAKDPLSSVEVTPFSERDVVWKEIYVVTDEAAAILIDILKTHGFFEWSSMVDSAKHDGVSWKLAVKTPSKVHASILASGFQDSSIYERFIAFQRSANARDSERKNKSEEFFEMVDAIRRIARERGVKVSGREQVDGTLDATLHSRQPRSQ